MPRKSVKMCERCGARPAKKKIRGIRLGLLCQQCISAQHREDAERKRRQGPG